MSNLWKAIQDFFLERGMEVILFPDKRINFNFSPDQSKVLITITLYFNFHESDILIMGRYWLLVTIHLIVTTQKCFISFCNFTCSLCETGCLEDRSFLRVFQQIFLIIEGILYRKGKDMWMSPTAFQMDDPQQISHTSFGYKRNISVIYLHAHHCLWREVSDTNERTNKQTDHVQAVNEPLRNNKLHANAEFMPINFLP